jgi:hypothetical protein
MAITHVFKSSLSSYGHKYFGYIDNNQLVLGRSNGLYTDTDFRGTYEEAKRYLAWLKGTDPILYNDIEVYFTKHDPDILCSHTLSKVGALKPGDKFRYKDTEYLMLDFKPSECFISAAFSNLVGAVNLSTYKVICLDTDWEVELLNN